MDHPPSPTVPGGERIAGYRLVRVLGEGGMGVVYLAEQTEPDVVGGWPALEAVGGIAKAAGLPDWLPSLALALLVIGLPIVLATAVVQEGIG
jgi:hypothetical protein